MRLVLGTVRPTYRKGLGVEMTEKPEQGKSEQGAKEETPSISDILSAGGFETKRVLEDWVHGSDLNETTETNNHTTGN